LIRTISRALPRPDGRHGAGAAHVAGSDNPDFHGGSPVLIFNARARPPFRIVAAICRGRSGTNLPAADFRPLEVTA